MTAKRDSLRNLVACVVMFNAGVISAHWFEAHRTGKEALVLAVSIGAIFLVWDFLTRSFGRSASNLTGE